MKKESNFSLSAFVAVLSWLLTLFFVFNLFMGFVKTTSQSWLLMTFVFVIALFSSIMYGAKSKGERDLEKLFAKAIMESRKNKELKIE